MRSYRNTRCFRWFAIKLVGLLTLISCMAPPAPQPPTTTVLAASPIAQPATLTPTAQPTPTYTSTPTATATPTPSPTITLSPLPSHTPTPVPTSTPTATPEPTPQPLGPGGLPFPLSIKRVAHGVAAHLFYVNRALPLQRAGEAGFGWIRQQIHWRDIEGSPGSYAWNELDSIVEAVHRANFKLLLSVVRSPHFYTSNGGSGMPKRPETLGRFLAALTERYRGRVQAIEIWNEQNLAHENGGRVSIEDAGHYVELLKAAYTSIKAIDPGMYVIAGPPSSTGVTDRRIAVDDMAYYAAMYEYQAGVIRDYFDAQAVHPGGAANPPDTKWPESPSTAQGWTDHPTFYFRHVEDVRALMVEHGLGDHQIWITEFGWATPNTTPGFEFGDQVSFEQQADYIVGAMRLTHETYPWVGALFLWNLNFAILRARSGQPFHEQASFAILNSDGSPRPSFLAIQQYLAGYTPQN